MCISEARASLVDAFPYQRFQFIEAHFEYFLTAKWSGQIRRDRCDLILGSAADFTSSIVIPMSFEFQRLIDPILSLHSRRKFVESSPPICGEEEPELSVEEEI